MSVILEKPYFNQYDRIASIYDTLFQDTESLEENERVKEMIDYKNGSVYEIGCGTGLLVEMLDIPSFMYHGVDPSGKMVSIFKRKHPEYSDRISICTYEQEKIKLVYDYIISIFGSVSYVQPYYLPTINDLGKNLFLMFYKPDYYPITYKKANVKFRHYNYTKEMLRDAFKDANVIDFNQYIIVRR